MNSPPDRSLELVEITNYTNQRSNDILITDDDDCVKLKALSLENVVDTIRSCSSEYDTDSMYKLS